jgi:hypothetical protein
MPSAVELTLDSMQLRQIEALAGARADRQSSVDATQALLDCPLTQVGFGEQAQQM